MLAKHLLHTLRSQKRSVQPTLRCTPRCWNSRPTTSKPGRVFATILAGHENAPARQGVPFRLLGGLYRLQTDSWATEELCHWYPSVGCCWYAESSLPYSIPHRHRPDRITTCNIRSTTTYQRGRSIRGADQWAAAPDSSRGSPILFPGKIFRFLIER